MTIKAVVSAYHRAGFPCLWLETAEPDRTTREAREELLAEDVPTFTWDLLQGVRDAGGRPVAGSQDPVQALTWLSGAAPEPCVLVASLLHRLAGSAEVQQAVITGASTWKATQRMLVVLAPPSVRPPLELERVCHVVEQPLPSAAQLRAVVERLAAENQGITVPDAAAVGEALRGLTEAEAENVAALAAVRDAGEVRAADVWGETATVIRTASGGALELRQPSGSFDTLGGLARLKAYAGRAARSPMSRGIILLGVPGGGKTAFALALGAELARPVYLLDVGRLFGSLVGESEAAARRATSAIDAAGRCVLLVDEIEKGCAGMGGSGANDSGVTARTMGHLLTWLSDRTPGGAYVVGTCNDVSKLPPEMTRAGRWDATFFVDLPATQEREAIYRIHSGRHGVTEPFPSALTEGWTGAEVECLCVQSELLGGVPLTEAAEYVVPLSRSRGEEIQALRTWAQGRCVPAGAPVEQTAIRARRVRGINEN
jgi:hypothetical protein